MEELSNHYRERTVACLMAQYEQADLSDYAPEAEAASLAERYATWMAMDAAERRERLGQQMHSLHTAEEIVMLGEIHPQWIADVLSRETPRVIGVMLRFLPSQHTRAVIEKLPATMRQRLPSVVESFSVPDAILRLIRQKFESHFLPVKPMHHVEELSFAELSALSLRDLRAVLHDIGIEELARAFRRLAKPALRLLLNRLNFADAQSLSRRIGMLDDDDPTLDRDAQNALLGMSFEHVNPDILIDEIAIVALAKSLRIEDLPMVRILQQKLPPHLAYVLQRDAETHVRSNHPEIVRTRQQRIMLRVGELVHAERLDRVWWDRLPAEVRNSVLQPEADGELRNEDSADAASVQAV